MGGLQLSDAEQATCQGGNAKLGTPHARATLLQVSQHLTRCSDLAVLLLLVTTGWQG